ncbi:MAG: DUF692 domain-containing protein [Betaproteobacteria bacterium]|nr:DUF692 domain-containing protein [Betaproteobacteria bacterium]
MGKTGNAVQCADRVGIGWRGELAAGIFTNIDRIDLLEIIADDHFRATPRELRALRTLATQTPITLHGVSMGLAGSEPTETRRMESMARLVDALQPESWSEHLAFVRGGGIEIGHLAAPPRTEQNVQAAIANIERATQIVGSAPHMENIATLIDPPASTMDEATWVSAIIAGSRAGLLLDLHNLYANALNFGMDPAELLLRFPLQQVRAVHLSGGKWIPEPAMDNVAGERGKTRMRLLDDHVHDVPDAVFELLARLAQHAPRQLDVIIERDGEYPDFTCLLTQLDAARDALRRGRQQSMAMRKAA